MTGPDHPIACLTNRQRSMVDVTMTRAMRDSEPAASRDVAGTPTLIALQPSHDVSRGREDPSGIAASTFRLWSGQRDSGSLLMA